MSSLPSRLLAILAVLLLADMAAAAPRRHALLIGCTAYPSLPAERQLQGVPNDVALLTRVLKERYQFTDADIRIVTDAEAETRHDEKLRPTRANIEREMRELAERAGKGEQVFIWLSGHGCRAPEPETLPAGVPRKPSGLRQAFLPRDIGRWEASTQKVERAILDYELRDWVGRVAAKGALVCVVVDACHSGTLCRATTRERSKEVPMDVLGVSAKDAAAAQQRASKAGDNGTDYLSGAAHGSGLAAIYASRPEEETVEAALPVENSDKERKWHGLLTYTLCQELLQSNGRLTHRDLVQSIRRRYEGMGKLHPIPQGEFEQDREVLGQERRPPAPFRLTVSDGQWSVNGGSLHGLCAGSILEVMPPAGSADADKPLGHVRIVRAEAWDADVEAIRYGDDREALARVPAANRCRPVYVDYGDLRLKVAVLADRPIRGAFDTDGRRSIEAELARQEPRRKEVQRQVRAAADAAGALFRSEADPLAADWLVCVRGDEVSLLRHGTLTQQLVGSQVPAWMLRDAAGKHYFLPKLPAAEGGAPIVLDLKTAPLPEWLTRVARVEMLRRLAAASQTAPAAVGAQPGQSELSIEIKFRQPGRRGEIDPAGSTGVSRGDEIEAQILNRSERSPVYLTVFHIDADFTIRQKYPAPGTDSDKLNTDQGPSVRLRVGAARAAGPESLVVIAASALGRDPIDFGWLTQPRLADARKGEREKGIGRRSLDTPLGLLFQSALYGEGKAKGVTLTATGQYLMDVRSWSPRPGEPPAPGK